MSGDSRVHPKPEDILSDLMKRAEQTGVESYEVYLVRNSSLAVAAKEGRIDQVRRNDELSAALRLIDRGRLGFSYISVFTPSALERVVSQAGAGAELSDPRAELGLPDPPAGPYPETVGVDPAFFEVSQGEKMSSVLEMEAAARAADPRVERVRQAEYRESEFTVWLANSHGIHYEHSGTVFSGSIMVKAVEGEEAEAGYEADFARVLKNLDLKAIGRSAAKQAVSGLGGRKVRTGRGPILLENRVVAEFLGVLAGSFLAENVQKGKSLLADKMDQKIMSPKLNLVDDGLYPTGLVTAPADAEGTPRQKTVLVRDGVLTAFLYDFPRAQAAGTVSTGNAGRGGAKSPPGVTTTNFMLDPGHKTPEDLARELGEGLLVTEVMGAHTANPISGDFSIGVSGTWIKGGQPDQPVKGMALAGNVLTMFDRVVGIGTDLKFFGSIGAPSLLIEELALSGD